jgi:hypothetical protein
MSKKNIIIALVGGGVVGALGTAALIWTSYAAIFVTASGLVATIIAMITGIKPEA